MIKKLEESFNAKLPDYSCRRQSHRFTFRVVAVAVLIASHPPLRRASLTALDRLRARRPVKQTHDPMPRIFL